MAEETNTHPSVSVLAKPKEHSSGGLRDTFHGFIYQLKLNMLFLKRGLEKGYSFRLASEWEEAEKFDDLVFEYENENKDGTIFRFLQAKHRQDDTKTISESDLLTEKDYDFSVQKYFVAYRKIKRNPQFNSPKATLKDFIICTNINLEKDLKQNSFQIVEDQDELLDIDFGGRKSERLKFLLHDFPLKEKLVGILKNTSELHRLTRLIAEYVECNKTMDLIKEKLFQYYHVLLAEKVVDVEKSTFREEFINGISEELQNFRKAFIEAASKNGISEENFWKKMKSKKLKFTKDFGKQFVPILNPKISSPRDLAVAIANLMIKAKHGVVHIKQENSKNGDIVKENIEQLAGHVLVEKDGEEKDVFYFSSAFRENKSLPGNLNKFRIELRKHDIEFETNKYKFCIKQYNTCREEQLFSKPSLPNEYISEDEINCFLDVFILALNQPNEVELAKAIKNEMSSYEEFNLIDNDFVASNFQREMLDWMKEKKGKFLTHVDGEAFFEESKRKLAKLILIGPTVDHRIKINEIGITFKKSETSIIRSFLFSGKKQIFNIITQGSTTLGSIKVFQILRERTEFKQNDSHIFMLLSSILRIQNLVLKAFQSNRSDLLVIECDSKEKNKVFRLCSKLSDILSKNSKKKIILISEPGDELAEVFMEDEEIYQEYRDDSLGFNTVTSESQKFLLKEKTAVFQGKNITLEEILNSNHTDIIDAKILSKLVRNELIEIGEPLLDLEETRDYFINRALSRCEFLRDDCLTKPEFTSKFDVIYNIVDLDKIDVSPYKDIILISNSIKDFKTLCNRYKGNNIHLFKKQKNDLIWQKSYKNLTSLRPYVNQYRKSFHRYPVSIMDISEKIVFVSSGPGNGKSTILTHLAEQTKETYPSWWIVRLNLIQFTENFTNFKCENVDIPTAVNFLLELLELKTSFEIELFRIRCTVLGKIALMCDGFDEISPDFKEKFIRILLVLQNTKIEKLWVTTRTYMSEDLENNFGLFSFNLEPFEDVDQLQFLQKFWSKGISESEINEKRVKLFCTSLLERLSSHVSDQNREFTCVPLQIRMIAEIFEETFRKFYFSKGEDIPFFANRLDIFYLYVQYVNIKYEVYCKEKKKQDVTNLAVKEDEKIVFKSFLENHKLLALSTLIKESDLMSLISVTEAEEITCLVSKIAEGKEKKGFISQVVAGRVIFIHRTFAEYFAALWFVDYRNRENVRKFLRENMFKREFKVFRDFFDRMLVDYVDECNIHNDILSSRENLDSFYCSSSEINKTDKGGRTSFHLAASYGYEIIIKELIKRAKEVVQDNTNDNVDVINSRDNLFGWSPVSYADAGHHWSIVETLLMEGADGKDIFEALRDINMQYNGMILFLLCAHSGFLNIAKVLLLNYPDLINIVDERRDAMTALHLSASFHGYLEFAKYIVEEKGADVYKKDRFNRLPLHIAASTGNDDFINWFLDYVQRNIPEKYDEFINATDVDQKTPLYLSIEKDCDKTMNLLINREADINIANKNGMTPLHLLAFKQGKTWMLRYFLRQDKSKLDINRLDNEGNTPINLAAIPNDLSSIGDRWFTAVVLAEAGADVNLHDSRGRTPLHMVLSEPRIDVYNAAGIKKLINLGANVNCKTKDCNGDTPLILLLSSCKRTLNLLNALKYLVAHKADVLDRNNFGHSVLHALVRFSDTHVLEEFLEFIKINQSSSVLVELVNLAENEGNTPLLWAVEDGNCDIVKILLKIGADIYIRNKKGMTVLHLAVLRTHSNMVHLLINNNANPLLENEDGDNAFCLAQKVYADDLEDDQKLILALLLSVMDSYLYKNVRSEHNQDNNKTLPLPHPK